MKKKYEELAVKYKLPSYEEMVKNFEIDSIGKDDILMKEVLKKIFDKIDFYTRTMEALIQPDSNYGTMTEASALSSEEQKLVKKLYIDGMFLTRQFTEFGLEYSEEEAGKFINQMFAEWLKLKPELRKVLGKIKEVWKKEYSAKQDRGYFG